MSDFLNKIDFLSPPITLFHLEKRTHTSKIGGCFLILMLSIISAYISFLLYDLIDHKKLTTLFHKNLNLKPDIIHSTHLQFFISFKYSHQKMVDTLINTIQNILEHIQLMFVQILLMEIYIYMIIGFLILVEKT